MYTATILGCFLASLLTFASCHELHETTSTPSPFISTNNAGLDTRKATSSSTSSSHLTTAQSPQLQHLKANTAPESHTTSAIPRSGGTKTGPREALICYAHPELNTSWCVFHGITVAMPKTMSSSISASISARLSVQPKRHFMSLERDSTSTIVETQTASGEGDGSCSGDTKSTSHMSQVSLLGGFNCTTLCDGEVQCFRTGSVLSVLATTTVDSESHPSSIPANPTSSTDQTSVAQTMHSTSIPTGPTDVVATSDAVVTPTPTPTYTSADLVVSMSSVARGENLRNQDLQGVLLIPMLYAAFGI
ncbi:hypothetical protein BJ875DRAFT_452326 [Amylocarpus encephaloides]|uniref:Uncharacterized protein n=1 Tax=Amylocarpus encephaloides TaxID=45428 RepID=A0A9P7YQP6_9HELO|nr:hypothetical protein BJ875DRAFT_452326 [Amylocarpus encephaloides]